MSRNKPSSPSAAGRDAGAANAGTPPVPGAAGAGGTGATDPNPAEVAGEDGTGATGSVEGGPGPAFNPDAGSGPVGGAGSAGGDPGFGGARPSGDLGAEDRTDAQIRDYAARTTEGADASATIAGARVIEGDVSRPVAGVGAEAAATLAAVRPQEAARVLDAAAGSASDAPSIGAGGLVDLAAREIPGAVAVRVPVAARVGTAASLAPALMDAGGSHGAAPEPLARRVVLASALLDQPVTGAKLAAPQPESREALAELEAAGFDFVVTSRQLNFRRAGVVHPTSPTLRRSEDFSDAEMRLLMGEPMLVVTLL